MSPLKSGQCGFLTAERLNEGARDGTPHFEVAIVGIFIGGTLPREKMGAARTAFGQLDRLAVV